MSDPTPAGRRHDGIHITRWGSGPAVVLVHGSGHGDPGGGAQKWKFQRPLAEQGWTLVVPDRPGQGESPSQGPDDYEADGPWVAELLGDGAHLVGHSYGGAIAVCAAGLRSESVRSLTLIEAPIFSAAADRPEARAQAQAIRDAMAAKIPVVGIVKAFKALGIPRDPKLRERPPISALRALAKGFKTMRPPDAFDFGPSLVAVKAAGVPVLFVEGGWSPGFKAIGEGVAAATGGELLSIPAGHHFPQMVNDGTPFNTAWQRFVAAAPVRAR
jgi:pimeloyl-ACP methyl ester carboxylesterase